METRCITRFCVRTYRNLAAYIRLHRDDIRIDIRAVILKPLCPNLPPFQKGNKNPRVLIIAVGVVRESGKIEMAPVVQ